jgi:hypothetical protein
LQVCGRFWCSYLSTKLNAYFGNWRYNGGDHGTNGTAHAGVFWVHQSSRNGAGNSAAYGASSNVLYAGQPGLAKPRCL